MSQMHDPLFSPIALGPLELRNRIVMPAMHLGMAQRYAVTDRLVGFHAERARGGAGLVIVGYATVDGLSGNPTCIGGHDDAFLPGLTRLASAIRAGGARAGVQLNHAGRYNHSFLLEKGLQPVAPSPQASRMTKEVPHELGLEEIAETVRSFGRAAARVKAAGFEAVELLAGTGYLVSEFLSPLTNRRTDGYGGSFANRARFGLEVLQAIKAALGPEIPVLVRMNGNDFMPGGNGREELRRFAALLVEAGAAALHVNAGWHEAQVPQIVAAVPRGAFAYLARDLREHVGVPVIASHRINTPEVARELLLAGTCDLVAMGRALIADPRLPERAQRGEEAAVRHCVACGQGCLDHVFRLRPVECLANPRAGHELEPERVLTTAATPCRVLVVGGGPAGMSAAAAAAERGHRVTLCEAGPRLGGQLLLAASPPGRQELLELVWDLEAELRRQGVEVLLGRRADASLVAALQPDRVLLATGARPVVPAWAAGEGPGSGVEGGPAVVQAWDVLAGRAAVGERVIVAGGGSVGVETALALAARGTLPPETLAFLLLHGAEPAEELVRLARRGCHQVTLVELRKKLGEDLGASTRWVMMQELDRFGVERRCSTCVVGLSSRGLRVRPAAGGPEEDLPADTIVLALGATPQNELQQPLAALGLAPLLLGDAAKIGDAFQAVHQGYLAGASL